MLSRVADAVYWMGRYLERAENITRLLLVTDDLATETQGFAEDLAQTAWKDILAILPSAELTRPVSAFAPLSLPYLQAFFVDGKNPYSVHYSLRKARENARAVREALTVEVFMSINETFRAVEAHGERRPTRPACATRSPRRTKACSASSARSRARSPATRRGTSSSSARRSSGSTAPR